MSTNGHPPSLDAYLRLLTGRGLTVDQARAWAFLRHTPGPETTLVLEIPLLYRDAGHAPDAAVEWFFLGVVADHATDYVERGWSPDDLLRLRQAIYDTKQVPRPPADSPFEPQAHEEDWIRADVAPELAPLYVLAGHAPGVAQLLDRKRRLGDTTIKPALRTMAALRDTPAL